MKNIRIEEDTIFKNLKSIIKHENKDAIIKLLHDMLIESINGSEYFIKFVLHEEYPQLPIPGATGYLLASRHYKLDTPSMHNSGLILNGYIECMVTAINSITNYCPIAVEIPFIDDNGKLARTIMHVSIDDFYPSNDDF